MQAEFERSGSLSGTLTVPGDKSISHRAAILAALSDGGCRITGFSPAADCASTLACLRSLGVPVVDEAKQVGVVTVTGVGQGGFRQPEASLDAGNSGTTMRLLAGALASQPLDVTIAGDESLSRRPMQRIIEPLSLMGAAVSAGDGEGHPPLRVRGGPLTGIDYSPTVASAQVKTAVLLAGLGAEGATTVREKLPTRDHTERLLTLMGVPVAVEGTAVTVRRGTPRAVELRVPGDLSSAAFVLAAALVVPGSRVRIEGVGLNPTRTGFLEILDRMGAQVTAVASGEEWEPCGSIEAKQAPLRAVTLDGADVAAAIDEVPLIAMLACFASGRTIIGGAGELRHKESDRIAATVRGLAALGADISETDDGMVIAGPCELAGATVDPAGDHRLAMMLAVAGLAARGRTTVLDWQCSEISYPGFAGALAGLGASVG